MGIARLIIGLSLVPHLASAEVPDLICHDAADEWSLSLDGQTASFAYVDRISDMQIMQQSVAEGLSWPIAMTVVGPRDSAIIIIEQPVDESYPVRVLTQRGETPILLAGTCRAPT